MQNTAFSPQYAIICPINWRKLMYSAFHKLQIDSLFIKWTWFSIDSTPSSRPGAYRAWWGTDYASMTLWLWWEMLHVGNYSWQPFSKAPGIVNICDCTGRSCVALCALLGHSCGEEGNHCSHWSQPVHLSERIITSCSPSVFMALGLAAF